MFINGTSDTLVPPKMTKQLMEAAKASRLKHHYEVKGGGHNDTYFRNRTEYLQKVGEFLAQSKL
jgi:fermentation-respiration switch protein FrsA (DUF1100 family)